MQETFFTLLRDSAHWEFELFVGFIEMIVFDVIIGYFVWPHVKHHLARDRREANENLGARVPIHYEFKNSAPPRRVRILVPTPGECPFCQSPTVVHTDGSYEHCEICGATRVHDEWIESDAPTAVQKDQRELENI
jgi:hypothetical protein